MYLDITPGFVTEYSGQVLDMEVGSKGRNSAGSSDLLRQMLARRGMSQSTRDTPKYLPC